MIWEMSFRSSSNGVKDWSTFRRIPSDLPRYVRAATAVLIILLLLTEAALPFPGRKKKDVSQYGEGLIVNIPLPTPEVAQVVEEITQNTIIRGTKEYNKDEYVSGAVAATSTPVFAAWKEGGTVFYKVRTAALDPRNFKDSGDVGTLAVRYVVQPQGDKNTVLRIDALFVEDFRHRVHQSNGSVETAEYKDIQDRLAAVELVKKETAEALQAKQDRQTKQNFGLGSDAAAPSAPALTAKSGENVSGGSSTAESANSETTAARAPQSFPAPTTSGAPQVEMYELSGEPLKQHVAELRRQVERLVKKPGAPLKSAPFHTASTLQSLEPGVEVLIQIATPYWYGVETREGQHGWIRRDQLEQAP